MSDSEILVVEDEPLILLEIETALEEAGFSVLSSRSAEDALSAFNAKPEKFKALITDIRLGPGKSGWDLARLVREASPTMPVIYVSGDSAIHWSAEGVPNSVMIPKPFFMPQVITALATLLNGQPPASL
ncbi:response regulator [Mesorhizobium sp. WSM3860]|uniref:response regulator n=1 Tax=Mesorhizobium sp. WSM3860 TaxID=2029403 RepID=UPI000BAE6E31|nr:response regulator [Mesorhizobium sp. WSM3860]PBC02669.1 response regulator [Mesorhizobium sp. WSM3860]